MIVLMEIGKASASMEINLVAKIILMLITILMRKTNETFDDGDNAAAENDDNDYNGKLAVAVT